MNRIIISLTLILIAFSACTPTTDEPADGIIGRWKIEKMNQGENDLGPVLNPNSDRWIQFNDKGTYESGGTPFGPNSGIFTFEDTRLYLDSDAGEADDSYWLVSYENGNLILSSNEQEQKVVTRVEFTMDLKESL